MAHERVERRYNLKTRCVTYSPGQELYKRNFVLSDFRRNLNAKFCQKYTKCRVVRSIDPGPQSAQSIHLPILSLPNRFLHNTEETVGEMQ